MTKQQQMLAISREQLDSVIEATRQALFESTASDNYTEIKKALAALRELPELDVVAEVSPQHEAELRDVGFTYITKKERGKSKPLYAIKEKEG